MSVAIHPTETRRVRAPVRSRLRVVAGLAVGGVALAAFTAGASSFFSGLADPRVRPARVVPLASQWPDLKDGVPALAEASPAPAEAPPELRRASLPAPEPYRDAVLADTSPAAAAPQAAVTRPASGRPALPIEPARTIPASARTAPLVAPAKLAAALPPSRAETVRAKEEPAGRFVSLPAPKAKMEVRAEPARTETPHADIAKPAPAQAARKPAPQARTRVTEAKAGEAPAAQAAPSARAESDGDEPELLGVKIPGGRQIRAGWDATVGGLLGGKSDSE